MPLSNFRQVFMPYGFRKKEGPSGPEWVAFNRERSPLGCVVPHFKPKKEDFSRAGYYEQRADRVKEPTERILARMTKNVERYAADIAFSINESRTEFYLYDDGCLPDSDEESWNMYQLRLEALCLAGCSTRKPQRLKKIIEKLKGKA